MLALRRYHQRALRYEQRHDIHRLIHQAAAVAAQVQYQACHFSVSLQFLKSPADIPGTVHSKAADLNISGRIIEETIIHHIRDMNPLPGQGHLRSIAPAAAHYGHIEDSAWTAAHSLTALVSGKVLGADSLYRHHGITRMQSGFYGRRPVIRLHYDDVTLLCFLDKGTDTAITCRSHDVQILLVLLRNKYRVRVEGRQHRIYTLVQQIIQLYGIHILRLQGPQDH